MSLSAAERSQVRVRRALVAARLLRNCRRIYNHILLRVLQRASERAEAMWCMFLRVCSTLHAAGSDSHMLLRTVSR